MINGKLGQTNYTDKDEMSPENSEAHIARVETSNSHETLQNDPSIREVVCHFSYGLQLGLVAGHRSASRRASRYSHRFRTGPKFRVELQKSVDIVKAHQTAHPASSFSKTDAMAHVSRTTSNQPAWASRHTVQHTAVHLGLTKALIACIAHATQCMA